jgi:hypothetical protein
MPEIDVPKGRLAVAACLAALTLAGATAAHATACRITDFTDRTLSSLSEKQRLSFITEMTQTEYMRIKALKQGDPNFDAMIAASSSISDAREAAYRKLESFNIENIDDYRKVWAADWLTDKGLQDLTNCISSRQPGLLVMGRPETASEYHLTITHLTPIGIEKITTKLVATYNVANVTELEAFLTNIGPRDNYKALTFPVKLADPKKRAVVILRGGWETPVSYYIPAAGA